MQLPRAVRCNILRAANGEVIFISIGDDGREAVANANAGFGESAGLAAALLCK